MSRRTHHHHHYHYDRRRDGDAPFCRHESRGGRPGVIRRVTGGIGEKLGVHRKWVLAAFIVGLFLNLPLTLVVFLAAWYWVDHPGRIERTIDRAAETLRDTFGTGHGPQPAGAGHGDAAGPDMRADARRDAARKAGSDTGDVERDADFDFAGLRRRFADLERRAGEVEGHVASDEYRLEREFRDMKGDGDAPA
jgi:phage shock protein PspC (stress-responsive transcriptional regulator)